MSNNIKYTALMVYFIEEKIDQTNGSIYAFYFMLSIRDVK